MIKCRIHDAESIGKLKAQFQFAKHLSQLVPTGSGVDIQRWDWFHPFPGCDGLGLGVNGFTMMPRIIEVAVNRVSAPHGDTEMKNDKFDDGKMCPPFLSNSAWKIL